MKVFELLARDLRAHGVESTFGVMGDANMRLISHFVESGHGRFFAATHEAGAVAAADGYHRLTGKPGIASVTHGPGLTNAVTALTEGARSRSSIAVLTAETTSVRGTLQNLDVAATVHPTGAGYERVYSPATAVDDLRRTLRRCHVERRPVVLNVPADLASVEVDQEPRNSPTYAEPAVAAPDRGVIEELLAFLLGSDRPVILAGRGAARAGAAADIATLAEMLGCPVGTTLLGREMFARHSFNIGICGTLGSPLATEIVGAADCVVVFGASLNKYTTMGGDLLDGKKVVQIDRDPGALGAVRPVNHAICGDAAAVARGAVELLRESGLGGSNWGARYQKRLENWSPREEFVPCTEAGFVDPRLAMIRLDEVLSPDRTVVSDVGRFITAAWRYLTVADPMDFTHTSAFGAIGLGLGTAIGAAIAVPRKLTVAVLGDGGFMMSLGELSTAVRYKIPLLVVVIDDDAYGAEYKKLSEAGHDPGLSILNWPDIAEISRGMGASSVSVRDIRELDAVADRCSSLQGPLVVDIKVNPRRRFDS